MRTDELTQAIHPGPFAMRLSKPVLCQPNGGCVVRQACPEPVEGLTTNGINNVPFALSLSKGRFNASPMKQDTQHE